MLSRRGRDTGAIGAILCFLRSQLSPQCRDTLPIASWLRKVTKEAAFNDCERLPLDLESFLNFALTHQRKRKSGLLVYAYTIVDSSRPTLLHFSNGPCIGGLEGWAKERNEKYTHAARCVSLFTCGRGELSNLWTKSDTDLVSERLGQHKQHVNLVIRFVIRDCLQYN